MESFLLVFIPIFVAIDPVGVLPLFVGLTEDYTSKEKKKLALQAVFTALIIGLLFAGAGHYILRFLGITTADFKIAGGLLLIIFSVQEIYGTTSRQAHGSTQDFIGIVPIGVPMIAGPAMITTLLILHDIHSFFMVALGLIANMVVTYVLFVSSDRILKKTGPAFGKVSAKVVAIFLAAIGIMMIRKGLEAVLIK